MRQEIEIPAIHDKDLRNILDKFNLSEKIDKGEIKCALCNKPITWENLFAIKIVDGQVILFCDEPNCIEQLNSEKSWTK
jgi:hypothetical protein